MKLEKPRNQSVDDIMLFVYGLISTMPIITIGGTTAYTYLMIFIVIYNFLFLLCYRDIVIEFNSLIRMYILISVFSVISAIVCITSNMQVYWKDMQFNKIILQICFLMLFVFYSQKDKINSLIYLVKGVYCASILQMIWGYGQLLFNSIEKINLNQLVFGEILKLKSDYGFGDSNFITGLCWHSSNMAPLLSFGFVMSKNKLLKLLFWIIAVACGNRTAMIGVTFCAVIQLMLFIKNHTGAFKVQTVFFRIGIVGVFIGIIFFVFSGMGKQYMEQLSYSFEKILKALDGSDGSTQQHSMYYLKTGEVFGFAGIINILFGFGIGCSGYPFSSLFGYYKGVTWITESDYIDTLWSYGIVGFVLRYLWYIVGMVKCIKVDRNYIAFFIPLLFMGITYNVIYDWTMVLLAALFLLGEKGYSLKNIIGDQL